MTPAVSQDMPSTGKLPRASLTPPFTLVMTSQVQSVFSFSSTETINDGQFHTVELVTFDQMVNLSIDGGLPTTMDSFGAVRPLNGEAPLYVGGRGPLQNTPPSSAGTLNYYTTVNHHPSPPRFVTTATTPSPQPCNPSTPSHLHPQPSPPSVVTVFARCFRLTHGMRIWHTRLKKKSSKTCELTIYSEQSMHHL